MMSAPSQQLNKILSLKDGGQRDSSMGWIHSYDERGPGLIPGTKKSIVGALSGLESSHKPSSLEDFVFSPFSFSCIYFLAALIDLVPEHCQALQPCLTLGKGVPGGGKLPRKPPYITKGRESRPSVRIRKGKRRPIGEDQWPMSVSINHVYMMKWP